MLCQLDYSPRPKLKFEWKHWKPPKVFILPIFPSPVWVQPNLKLWLETLAKLLKSAAPCVYCVYRWDTVCTALCRHSLPWHGQQRAIVRIQTAQWLFWAPSVWANEVVCLLSLSFPICRVCPIFQCDTVPFDCSRTDWLTLALSLAPTQGTFLCLLRCGSQ